MWLYNDIFRMGLQVLRPENWKTEILFVLIPLFPFFGIYCFSNRCYAFKVHNPCDVFFYWFTGPCGCHSHDCAIRVCTGWALLCSSIYSVVTREYIACALSWLIVYLALAFLPSRRWIDIDSRHVLGPCKVVLLPSMLYWVPCSFPTLVRRQI